MSQQTVAFGAEFDDTFTQLEELIDRLTENLADSLVQTAWALTQQARYHEEDLEPTLTKQLTTYTGLCFIRRRHPKTRLSLYRQKTMLRQPSASPELTATFDFLEQRLGELPPLQPLEKWRYAIAAVHLELLGSTTLPS
jgi:hypothetical protein